MRPASPGWRIERHRQVPSTNDLAKAAPPWTAVVAETQTAGRGRLGRTWHSPRGGLWLSAVVPPPVPAQGTVAQQVAGALGDVTGLPVRYQPPNDLVLFEKKLGGVLVEAVYQGGEAVKAVIGVGINVNNPARELPDPLPERAISLAEALGGPQDLEGVLRAVLVGIERAVKEERCRLLR